MLSNSIESKENYSNKATNHASEGSILALKPRGDVTRSPKQGYQWPHEKDLCPPKIFKKYTNLVNYNQNKSIRKSQISLDYQAENLLILKFNVTNFLIHFLINIKTSQLCSVDAVFVVNYFSVWLDVVQWRLLRHDQENLLHRHCDGVCSEIR